MVCAFFLPKERLGKLKAVGWWGRLDISGRFSRELDAICRLAIIETLQLQIAIAFATRVVSARAQPTVNHTHVATPYRTTSVRCRFRLQAPVVELSSLARALWRVTALELYSNCTTMAFSAMPCSSNVLFYYYNFFC